MTSSEFWAFVIVVTMIVWTIYYVYIYTRDHNWVWGLLILFACCTVTPIGVYLFRKFIDGI